MAAYVTQNEMISLWETSLESMISECKTSKKVPDSLIELIKHNLFAKYVCYNPAEQQIEIGVNESLQASKTYPTIKIYYFTLEEIEKTLLDSKKSKRGDQEFYAKVLKGRNAYDSMVFL